MASIDSDVAPQADAASQLSASSRDSDMTSKLQKARSLKIQLLKEITDDFSDERKIGQGAYGKVYVATLENGEDIAVKILHNNTPGEDDAQFQREFENLMRLDHENIVKLVAYCYETQHEPMQYFGKTIFIDKTYRALCFEYMENGSLQKHLSDECTGLDWNTRYKIIKGAWEGLKHLHQGFEEPIYHLDLKPDNILLDKNMLPKLADFGMSKMVNDNQSMITQSLMGTFGYLPIEFLHGKIVSNKLDIFSLGVVMIKVIGGPEAHSRSVDMGHQEFLDLVHANWRNRMQNTCASEPLEAYCKQVNICTEIALTCMEIDRHKRPNIVDIIDQLNETETVIEEALSWRSHSWSRTSGDLVNLRAFTGRKAIVDTKTERHFPVMVQVTARPWSPAEEMARSGVDIVVVVVPDTCKEEIDFVISKLSSNDWLSVAAGLGEAVEILRGREAEEGDSRVGCILLLGHHSGRGLSSEFPVHIIDLDPPCPGSMQSIAEKTSGTYSFTFCEDTLFYRKKALKLFLAGIFKVAARFIKITIKAHQGVTISSIQSGGHGNKVSSDQLSAEIDIRDIYAGETKNFVVYLTVAERRKNLVIIGARYRSLTATSAQLPNTNVFVLRPRSCSPAALAMHHEVAAELARIKLISGVRENFNRNVLDTHQWCVRSVWGDATFVDGRFLPGVGHLRNHVDTLLDMLMGNGVHYDAYEAAWLSGQQWQRATTMGYCCEPTFTPAQWGDADGEDDDSTKEVCP